MLFIAKAEIERHHYMSSIEKEKVIHPVEAENYDDAYAKFMKYYELQTRDYDVYVSVSHVEIFELIS